ncbi:hypothetical protein KKD62_01235 [Patescibacteria group bacterium]|nr:hypothetical protein [Patescibacteria group bacterium]MBU1931435.1 hypothetical protein [Patescibacteria group bacterium]
MGTRVYDSKEQAKLWLVRVLKSLMSSQETPDNLKLEICHQFKDFLAGVAKDNPVDIFYFLAALKGQSAQQAVGPTLVEILYALPDDWVTRRGQVVIQLLADLKEFSPPIALSV